MHNFFKGLVHEVCAGLPENSFDGCLCDPPYGIKFMGRQWDHGVPSAETWAEVLRVLKPGAHLLAFGGTRTYHRLACAIEDAGFEIRDCLMWLYGQGFPKSANLGGGYGTALKPAWEPCIVAMKPVEGTFANNAAIYEIAGLNIEEARIPLDASAFTSRNFGTQRSTVKGDGHTVSLNIPGHCQSKQNLSGRWPANLILDEESAFLLDEQSGILHTGARKAGTVNRPTSGVAKGRESVRVRTEILPDSGGASRFFYSAKVSKRERNAGMSRPNIHPTLKPIDLCRYLAKLILPPERSSPRRILVPFCGTGSEMIGALKAGWDEAIGIEQDREYCHDAEERLEFHHPSEFALVSAQDQ